jgi:5'-3' exonuclease
MGVPGFFSWLLRQYKNKPFILNNTPDRVSILYIDANCAFHPQCFKILECCPNERNKDKLEKKMFQRIENYIDYLISYVNPIDGVYISVDGVAPMAKISQQRKRRFRSIDDIIVRNAIKKKHKKTINDTWNNTVITPGTEFMEMLHNYLTAYIKKKMQKSKSKLLYIYSSYHEAGEGEHKILQHIKQRQNIKNKDLYVIYGLDADLFFLAMASQKTDIYLLRETAQLGNSSKVTTELYDPVADVAEDLSFISIDSVKDCYNKKIREIIETKIEQLQDKNLISSKIDIKSNFCNDFVFLCYLLGNDFLPHIPSLDIKKNGLDIILDIYTNLYILYGNHIINPYNNSFQLDMSFVGELFKDLSNCEYEYFTKVKPQAEYNMNKRRCFEADPYLRELWELENMKKFIINDPIKLGIGNESIWKYRYYEHYFHTSEYQDLMKDEICKAYLIGLCWVTKYYFDKCADWTWQFEFCHSPFISDMSNFINKNNFDLNNVKFDIHSPLQPCIQLLCVLPPSCRDLIPKTYRSLVVSKDSPIIDMFPEKVQLDMIDKDQYWQCIPIIPIIDIERIHNCTKKLKLSSEEEIRNKIF